MQTKELYTQPSIWGEYYRDQYYQVMYRRNSEHIFFTADILNLKNKICGRFQLKSTLGAVNKLRNSIFEIFQTPSLSSITPVCLYPYALA